MLHFWLKLDGLPQRCIVQELNNMWEPKNIYVYICVTGPLWGESTSHRWIPLTKASDAEVLYCLWSATEQTVEQTIETLVILDANALILMSLYSIFF